MMKGRVIMTWEKEREMFEELDTLLRQIADLEPTKELMKHGGAINIRRGKDQALEIKYEGGIFDRCQKKEKKSRKV